MKIEAVLDEEQLREFIKDVIRNLILEDRLVIRPYSYSGRGAIDVQVYLDGEFLSDRWTVI